MPGNCHVPILQAQQYATAGRVYLSLLAARAYACGQTPCVGLFPAKFPTVKWYYYIRL